MNKKPSAIYTELQMLEHDSCGIVAIIEKNGKQSHNNIDKSIDALTRLNHRSGFINEEGDGAGILTDIPRRLWANKLSNNKHNHELAYSPKFTVGHIFIDKNATNISKIQEDVRTKFAKFKIEIISEEFNQVDSSVLGPAGKEQEPKFWQIAAVYSSSLTTIKSTLYSLLAEIEECEYLHVLSLSNYSVAYKLLGEAAKIPEYFLDLKNPLFESAITLGHNRYSTNTLSHFFRVQPFSLIGHNGEINTIERLKDEAAMVNIPILNDGSDSQNLNRVLEGLIAKYNLSLFTAMEIIFPPIYNEIHKYSPKLKDLYTFLRHVWGPFSQGPAGIISRHENLAVFSVDALGLRPLWLLETEETIYFSSEQGIISSYELTSEPKPMAPGEKIGVVVNQDSQAKIINYFEIQQIVYKEIANLFPLDNYHKKLEPPHFRKTNTHFPQLNPIANNIYLGFGWEKEHLDLAEQIAYTGKEPIRSLGYDGPLAIMSKSRVNLSDFLKETVAVVTNPAIDREREIEHFSTRVILGGRENFNPHSASDTSFEIRSPILLEGEYSQTIVEELGTTSLEQIIAYYTTASSDNVVTLSISYDKNQTIKERLKELNNQAVNHVKNGAKILILDDQAVINSDDKLWLDPLLALASINNSLKDSFVNGENLRRNVSIILRSGAIRHLHDIVMAIGFGANAISPYLLFASISQKEDTKLIKNLFTGLNKGIEKVISTLGIHELRGYGRLFSAIGLNDEIVDVLNITNFYGSEKAGYSFKNLEADALNRNKDFVDSNQTFARNYRMLPRIWKVIGEVANGTSPYTKYKEKLEEQFEENPTTIRHILSFNNSKKPTDIDKVDIGINNHTLPFVISSMSFGSQNEIPFRAYAEAAYQLNMISLNGEGGEIKDMLGKYPDNRGMQVASGRFGVNIELLNSSNWIELKIGQGAKPGEGGHLPGSKVSDKVAAARNATPGTDLISPSNNHDIYSIEDLAQIIAEFKAANNNAKIIVKVPVVPNIGTIAVGIAKAGADVISLSGYDGGTGAARVHAIQHVGLPIEIGVKLAHSSLVDAGLRSNVEIWADGGIKNGEDVVKLVLLGANRIGFGTLAMFAVGCTACRGCHLDTCHVGICTQIDSVEQANERGLKRFVPREYRSSVENLIRVFSALAEETRSITANLGATSLQELVGRSDLLIQQKFYDLLDLSSLLSPILVNYEPKSNINTAQNQLSYAVGLEYTEIPDDNAFYYNYEVIDNTNRMLGSSVSGDRVRPHLTGEYRNLPPVKLSLRSGSIPGNGLAAYLADGINIELQGGGQDGVGKTAFGGKVILLKAPNKNGVYYNGSVGKGFGYGAQDGLFIIQGNADSRAGIRLSGADIIIGGEITSPIQDHLGSIATRANVKGFAFEYMTNGRAIVLGDPGPWICSGMTGGVIYQRLNPEMGFDIDALKRRIAKGAEVGILPIDEKGKSDLVELLSIYVNSLIKTNQNETANRIINLLANSEENFVRIVPEKIIANTLLLTE